MAGTAVIAMLAAVCLLTAGCGGGTTPTTAPGETSVDGKEAHMLEVRSTAFGDGEPIPARHTCEGADVSPPLAWDDLPAGTVSLALEVDDPDAPGGTFTHWLAWGIDPSAGVLAEGEAAPVEGRNGFRSRGYRGPCPPKGDGPHRYVFRAYALDAPLQLDSGADTSAFRAALSRHVLGTGELTGTYERR